MSRPKWGRSLQSIALWAGLILLVGCAGQQQRIASTPSPSAAESALANYRQPAAGLFTGGQPEQAEWQALAAAGITTVINLRGAEETPDRDEAAEVSAQGMRYLNIPVAGAADVNDATADRLWWAIREAGGPVLVHCASGNRVGALLALGAYRNDDRAAAAALAFGQEAGLSRLEPVVRERLDCRPPAAGDVADAGPSVAASDHSGISCVGN
ncbi:MAG: hypothetical protein KDI75_11790 [Xanthomonadales bacterium]|nr:hypothetical protein [Xanthomonadales bacterium]